MPKPPATNSEHSNNFTLPPRSKHTTVSNCWVVIPTVQFFLLLRSSLQKTKMAPSEDINTANKYLFIGNKRTSQLRKLQINLIDLFCANFSTSQIVKKWPANFVLCRSQFLSYKIKCNRVDAITKLKGVTSLHFHNY